jgi:beta-barrel assembly-enhancing protease
MIPAVIASLAISSSPAPAVFACGHSHALPDFVAMAWQEADTQSGDPRHLRDLQRDREVGKKYSEIADKEVKLSEDKEKLARVQRIGAELGAIANQTLVTVSWGDPRLNPFEYEFKLIDDKDINAFSLPGGFIYVNTGLLDYAESDDELAGVLGHEIAHASFRHLAYLEREREKLSLVQLPLILIAIMTGGARGAGEALTVSQLYATAKGSGWSVSAEQAADYGGFQYLMKSKYDPTGMLTFMERLAKDERSRPQIDWGIFRTHPPGRERADSLIRYMRGSGAPIRRSRVSSSFRSEVKNAEGGTEIWFGGRKIVGFSGADAPSRAAETAIRLNEFYDSMPELYDIGSGESGIVLGRRQPVIELKAEDAAAKNMSLKALQSEVVRNMRTALYGLAYRVWDAR